MILTFVLTLLFVKEHFTPDTKKTAGHRETWQAVPHKTITLILFASFFVSYLSLYSIEPILTVYISSLSLTVSHLAFMAGLIFSSSGLATMLSSPLLGRLSDRRGPHKILLVSLVFAGLCTLPQAFVTNPWQLLILRFLLGLATGGITPALNSLVKRLTPQAITGRIFGFTMAAGYLGVFAGSVLGGQTASAWGLRFVFFLVAGGILLNVLLVYFGVYRKVEHLAEA